MQTAVIGHGRSPEGRGWGPRIDGSDYVVRMWDCHWQAPADYGTAYHYGFFEIAASMMPALHQHCQREPDLGWVASALDKSGNLPLPPVIRVIHQERWTRVGQLLGGVGATGRLQFTRGTIAALWAIENLCGPGDRVVLVGFDNVHCQIALPVEVGFSETYRAQRSTYTFKGYMPNATRYGNHDFSIEGPVMELVASGRDVAVEFAQDVWA